MSEPKDINDPEEERRELSDEQHEEIDEESNTKEEGSPQLDAVGNLDGNGSELIKIAIVPKPSENVATDDGSLLEPQQDTEIPVFMSPNVNDSNQNDGSVQKNSEEKLEMDKELVENGDILVDAEETEVCAEENRSDETHREVERDEELTKNDGAGVDSPKQIEDPVLSFRFDPFLDGDDDGTEEDQSAFMRELENFHKEMNLEFKAPKFYGEGLNCLKLWRAVTRLGGYDRVTSCKLWRQVGESFNPPKTCTTVSWSFRCFYEKALLEYEKHKIRTGELHILISALAEPMTVNHQNKTSVSLLKRDKLKKNFGGLKRKKSLGLDHADKASHKKGLKPQVEALIVDVGQPADWVKINVKRTKDCFEVYALVPGLLREEVHVQSDPAGRLILSGEPDQPNNPWGLTPFKKVVTLPSRIDPHQTSAVVTLHGQLFVRAPFEQSDL